MINSNKKLFLLDAMALVFRAYYALNKTPRINSKGLNTSAILGFTNSLYEIIRDEKPTHIGVAFDSQGPTVRHVDYAAYKANRDNTPEDILLSLPYIKDIIDAFGIPVLELPGYEADDIIGTMAKKAELEGFTVFMMTTDKDYGQLVSENIFIYKPAHMGNTHSILGIKDVCEKYSIQNPEQLIDILGLWGDAVDNIPGVKGIGEVGAKKLIGEFNSIENILDNLDRVRNEKLREKLKSGAKDALMSKILATIILDVPLGFDASELAYTAPQAKRLKAIFDELEFKSLAQRIITDFDRKKPSVKIKKTQTYELNLFSSLENIPEEEEKKEQEKQGEQQHEQEKQEQKQEQEAQQQEEQEETKSNSIHTVEKNYSLINNLKELQLLAERLSRCTSFCFDTETDGLDPLRCRLVGLAIAFQPKEAFYIQFPLQKEETVQWLKILSPLFVNEHIEKIAQNLKFDMKVLASYGIEIKGKTFDTMLAHYILEPEMRHNLDSLAKSYLNYDMFSYEELVGKNKTIDQVPIEEVVDYSCEDADITFQLKELFAPKIKSQQLDSLFEDIEMPLVYVLAHMETTGVKLDTDFLHEYSLILQKQIDSVQKDIFELAGEEFNIASPKQLGTILFQKLRIIENAKLTKSKQYQTGEEVLQKLEGKHPIAKKILDYRGLSKLKSTYVDTFPILVNPETGRVHAQFNQAITATGRLSSSNPNLQNIPVRDEEGRKIREAFIPADSNHVLLAADYSQIELRLVAALSNDESMLDAFFNGVDIHTATAAKIYNVSIDDVTRDMRRNAKTVNFGIIYGISAFGLSERLNIPRREAAEIIQQYFDKYPKIQEYIKSQIQFAQENGYVETLMKRRRYLRNINSANGNLRSFDERNAINAPIQGSAADMIKVAMVAIYREMQKRELKSAMILQVHDELVFDVLKSELEEIKEIVHRNMIHAMTLAVPLEIDMKSGNNWLEAH
ncbi:MAG: DNA polymerase I [Bacteroidales bacterium]|jgi:DNA polymerase-1|nr:DNA polymerase I [Bacteroidales bacterium]